MVSRAVPVAKVIWCPTVRAYRERERGATRGGTGGGVEGEEEEVWGEGRRGGQRAGTNALRFNE